MSVRASWAKRINHIHVKPRGADLLFIFANIAAAIFELMICCRFYITKGGQEERVPRPKLGKRRWRNADLYVDFMFHENEGLMAAGALFPTTMRMEWDGECA